MSETKQKIYDLIDEISENDLSEVFTFISFIKSKREKELYNNIEKQKETNTDIWSSDIKDYY